MPSPEADDEVGAAPEDVVVALELGPEPDVEVASLATGGPGKTYGAEVS
jgi:hypothetical protein